MRKHNPCARPWSRQYMSAVFYQDDTQRRQAEEILARVARERGQETRTHLAKLETFYLAEDYHQKYYLRQQRDLAAEYLRIYPKLADFVDSTAVTRANGYVGGNGSRAKLEAELPGLGLSDAAGQTLLGKVRR